MKSLPLGLLALGLLTAPFAAFGDVQITSFEGAADPSVIDPWVPDRGTELTYHIIDTAATHGTSSMEIIYPMEGTTGTWGRTVSVPTENYASVIAQGTGIQADVYYEWPDGPGNPWFLVRLVLDSTQTGWVEIDATSGNVVPGQWRTLFFPMTADQVTKLTAPDQTSSNIGFFLGTGGDPISGTVKLRFDNIIVVGASASSLTAPTDLAGEPVLGGANLTWTATPNALTYTVKRRASLTGAYATIASGLTTTSYNDTGLEGNTTYYYVVTASDADSESSFSTSVAVTTPNDEVLLTSFESGLAPWLQGPATAAGGAPVAYTITTSGASEGTSSAEASIPMLGSQYLPFYTVPTANYRTDIAQSTGIKADVYIDWIDRPLPDGQWFNIVLSLSSNDSFVDIEATSGSPVIGQWQTLTWNLTPAQIAALTANQNTFSNLGFTFGAGVWMEGATMGGTFVIRVDNIRIKGFREVAVPAAPTGLAATGGAGQVDLTWNASATATGYTVQSATVSGGPYSTLANLGNVTSYSNTGLTAATTYYYVVTPVNAGGNGAASAEASATTEAVVLTGIAAWRQTHFGMSEATGDAANDADPDADGVTNLLEYALAGDPMVAEHDLLPVQSVESGHLKLSFDRIDDQTLTYEVRASDDLATWSAIWSSTGADNIPGFVTVTDPELLSAHARRFLRLRVTAP